MGQEHRAGESGTHQPKGEGFTSRQMRNIKGANPRAIDYAKPNISVHPASKEALSTGYVDR